MSSKGERTFLFYWNALTDLPEPEQEYRFHPERKWRLDFAWPDKKTAVEVHGATYSRGRHVRGVGFRRDREKMNEATLLGWAVLEFTIDMLTNDPQDCIDVVLAALNE